MRTVIKILVVSLALSCLAWGAGVTVVTATTSTANANSYASSAFTPAANDLLLVFVTASGTVSVGTLTDSQSLGFSQVTFGRKASTVDSTYAFVANALAANSSMTVTFNCSDDAATGAAISILRISGMSRTGIAAIRQSQTQNNQATATPAPVFAVAALTGNVVAGMVGNAVNPATITPPSGWTEAVDVGYATPTIGLETAYQASGFTGTTVTWGSSAGSAFGSIIVELDTSAASGLLPDPPSSVAGVLSGTSLTSTHVVNSGSNRVLYALVSVTDNSTNRDIISGVTYSGTAMKYLGRIQDEGGSELFCSIWELVAPATGSHDIVVTFTTDLTVSSSGPASVVGISFSGANQSYPHGLPSTKSSGTTNATTFTNTVADVATGNGDYIIGLAETHAPNIIPNGAQTVLANRNGFDSGSGQGFGTAIRRTDIGTSLAWTQSASDVWSSNAIYVRPATVTPTTPQLDQAGAVGAATAASSATITNLTSSGCTNGLLYYGASYQLVGAGATNITSISWNSQALTKLDESRPTQGGNVWATEIWYLKNPSAATATLTATLSGSIAQFVHGAVPLCLVDQTTTFGNSGVPFKANDMTNTSQQATVNVTGTTTSQLILDVLKETADVVSNTIQTGSKLWGKEDAVPGTAGFSQAKLGTGGTVAMTYDIPVSAGPTPWNIMAIPINFSLTAPSTGDPGEAGVIF